MSEARHTLTVHDGNDVHRIDVAPGANLRQVLLENGLSPYGRFTRRLNCGGRGLCATCGVWIEDEPTADHWHDRWAQRFGYPRLSCQIAVERDVVVHLLPDKLVWGA